MANSGSTTAYITGLLTRMVVGNALRNRSVEDWIQTYRATFEETKKLLAGCRFRMACAPLRQYLSNMRASGLTGLPTRTEYQYRVSFRHNLHTKRN